MCKTIKQKVTFKAAPEIVYDLLTDPKKFSALTGKKASIGRHAGEKFSVYGGQASGLIVELLPGVSIVQAWRRHSWPQGIYSMATFNLSPTKSGGTQLVLTHRGVPAAEIPSVELGWRKFNWEPMKKFLESN